MFMTQVKVAVAVLLMVGVAALAVVALADDEKPVRGEAKKETPTVRGTIKAVDAAKNTITVTVRFEGEKAAEDHTVTLSPDVKVATVDVPQARLADLKPRMEVVIRLSADEKSVVAIQEIKGEVPGGRERREERASIFGQVKTVDPVKNTITITIARDGGVQEERTLELSREARFVVPRKEDAKLADVTPGLRVWLTMAEDRRSVVLVRGDEGREGRGRRQPSVSGTVKAIEPGKSITLTVKDEGQTFDKSFPLAPAVKVFAGDERLGQLADVKPGDRVTLTFGENQRTVIGIRPFRGDGEERRPAGPRDGERKPEAPREGERKPVEETDS
jgi:hypothetical protein